MERKTPPVKTRRRYDSHRRREQAGRSRAAVLNAARRLFLERGYSAATLGAIAEAADVSVETIHKGFGGKRGLVRAIWQQSLDGTGPVPAWRRSDEMDTTEPDPAAVIRRWGELTAEVGPVAAPIALLIRAAAATDPEMAALYEEAEAARLERMTLNAKRLLARDGLREGLTLEQVRDVLWTYSSAELYELLVVRRGWSPEQYGRLAAEGMGAALLADRAAP